MVSRERSVELVFAGCGVEVGQVEARDCEEEVEDEVVCEADAGCVVRPKLYDGVIWLVGPVLYEGSGCGGDVVEKELRVPDVQRADALLRGRGGTGCWC